jgi:hypothetical protein
MVGIEQGHQFRRGIFKTKVLETGQDAWSFSFVLLAYPGVIAIETVDTVIRFPSVGLVHVALGMGFDKW